MNDENLKNGIDTNFKNITKEKRQEFGRRGGINSGIAKREKKRFKETLETIMSMSFKRGEVDEVENITSIDDLKGKNIDVQTAILVAQAKKAVNGDVVAATFIRDTLGQNPANKILMDASVTEKTPSDKVAELLYDDDKS